MRRQWILCLGIVLILVIIAPFAAMAAEQNVFDEAQIFTPDEMRQLEKIADDYTAAYGYDAVIVTTADDNGKSSQAFADDFYDQNGFAQDGVLFLINMDSREVYISTSGRMIGILDDGKINDLLDIQYGYVANGEYANAMINSFEQMEAYTKGMPAGGTLTAGWIVISILIGAGIAGLVVLIIHKQYKKEYKAAPYDYRKEAKLDLCNTADNLIDTRRTSRYIPPSDSSSSGTGSSTHTSSSGNTHGGGGRSF